MDVSNLATKKDLEKLATKAEFQRFERRTKADILELRTDMQKLDTKLDKLQNTLDGFVGTVDDLRTDNTVGAYQTQELQTKIDDHEKRLKDIEAAKHAS